MLAALRGTLASPRRRRRALWLGGLATLAGGVALTVVYVRNTAPSYDTPLRDEAPDVYREPLLEQLTENAAAAARATAFNFIRTAVLRRDLARSWDLVAPSLRRGFTRAEWSRGEIPVIPYPADLRRLRYSFEYSYQNVLGMSIGLWPRAGAVEQPIVFRMELQKAGTGRRTHWLVSSWAPPGVSLDVVTQRAQRAARARGTPISAETARGRTLSPLWLAVPGALLLGIVLVPLALGGRSWYRSRKAIRAYRAERGSDSGVFLS